MGTEPYTPAPPTQPQQLLDLLPSITALRLRYLQSGYTPLPCIGKAPALRNWQATPIDATQIKAWRPDPSQRVEHRRPQCQHAGGRYRYNRRTIGTPRGTDAAEIFTAGPRHSASRRPRTEDVDPVPRREARSRNVVLAFATPDGIVHRVEVLGDGQQFIAEGWHPDTGTPYTLAR